MGVNGLWEVIGDGEIVPIAEYAAKHFERYNRPLRIAVDEAGWRFSNLTDAVVAQIREKEPAANPIEKNCIWRILRLVKLNIQVLFVFDGPRRPWKRGRRGGRGKYWEKINLMEKMLTHLGIPHHRAPGEAEAECARLQQMGIVDVVWSDDSDSFMFGATLQMEAHKVDGKRVEGHVRIHNMENITRKHDLDAESTVLFAVLSGGDYHMAGLRGCGPSHARHIARRSKGLAHALCHATKDDLPEWREMLQRAVNVEVPFTFPDWKALNHYRNPTISTNEQLSNLHGLQKGWHRPVDQPKLRVFLRERFNFWTKGYMKHFASMFMIRDLCREPTGEHQAYNARYDINIKRKRCKKGELPEDSASQSELKVTFNPLMAVDFGDDISREPEGEDWNIWYDKKTERAYDPTATLECTVLSCILRNGLGDSAFDVLLASPAKTKTKKRKADNDGEEILVETAAPIKRGKKATNAPAPAESLVDRATSGTAVSKKRRRTCKDASPTPLSSQPKAAKKRKSAAKSADMVEPDRSASPPMAFRPPREIPAALMRPTPRAEAKVVDLCLGASSDMEQESDAGSNDSDLRRATEVSRAEAVRNSPLFMSPATQAPKRKTSCPSKVTESSQAVAEAPFMPAPGFGGVNCTASSTHKPLKKFDDEIGRSLHQMGIIENGIVNPAAPLSQDLQSQLKRVGEVFRHRMDNPEALYHFGKAIEALGPRNVFGGRGMESSLDAHNTSHLPPSSQTARSQILTATANGPIVRSHLESVSHHSSSPAKPHSEPAPGNSFDTQRLRELRAAHFGNHHHLLKAVVHQDSSFDSRTPGSAKSTTQTRHHEVIDLT